MCIVLREERLSVEVRANEPRLDSTNGSSEKSSRSFDPINHLEINRLMQKPHALVLLLPDADRQLMETAFFDGKTSVEIAEETGSSIDTIGSRLRCDLSTLKNETADTAGVSEHTGL
jgi:DNA-directed RNA polymerase specialized sigma24 family protein